MKGVAYDVRLEASSVPVRPVSMLRIFRALHMLVRRTGSHRPGPKYVMLLDIPTYRPSCQSRFVVNNQSTTRSGKRNLVQKPLASCSACTRYCTRPALPRSALVRVPWDTKKLYSAAFKRHGTVMNTAVACWLFFSLLPSGRSCHSIRTTGGFGSKRLFCSPHGARQMAAHVRMKLQRTRPTETPIVGKNDESVSASVTSSVGELSPTLVSSLPAPNVCWLKREVPPHRTGVQYACSGSGVAPTHGDKFLRSYDRPLLRNLVDTAEKYLRTCTTV